MIFTGWKMIMGLLRVSHQGQYAMILATLRAILVYKLCILKGLLLALALLGIVNFIVLHHAHDIKARAIIQKYFE